MHATTNHYLVGSTSAMARQQKVSIALIVLTTGNSTHCKQLTTPVHTLDGGGSISSHRSDTLLIFPTATIGSEAGRDTAASTSDVVLKAIQELTVACQRSTSTTGDCKCTWMG
jgi:hypothetical protein